MVVQAPSKDPARVAAGLKGARRRWGEPRVLRLDQIDHRIRSAILALIAADEAARKADSDGSPQEVERSGHRTTVGLP
jgi:hypothetical protein